MKKQMVKRYYTISYQKSALSNLSPRSLFLEHLTAIMPLSCFVFQKESFAYQIIDKSNHFFLREIHLHLLISMVPMFSHHCAPIEIAFIFE